MSQVPMETDDIVAVNELPNPVSPSILHLNHTDADLLGLPETELITALYDFMETSEENESNEVIVDAIDLLMSKYKNPVIDSTASSFEQCLKLTKFTFKDEPTESLIKAIQYFQQSSSESNKKPLVIKCDDIVTEFSRDFFELKLCQTINIIYKEPDDYNIDSQYSKILNICLHSKKAFQFFYKKIAQTMINHKFPENIQTFLDQFILDIRIRCNSNDDFYRMYSDDLYFYVKILNEVDYESQVSVSYTVKCLLNNLKSRDFWKFVILTTHFDKYKHLLEKKVEEK